MTSVSAEELISQMQALKNDVDEMKLRHKVDIAKLLGLPTEDITLDTKFLIPHDVIFVYNDFITLTPYVSVPTYYSEVVLPTLVDNAKIYLEQYRGYGVQYMDSLCKINVNTTT